MEREEGSPENQGPGWVHDSPPHWAPHTSAPAPLALGEDMLALQVQVQSYNPYASQIPQPQILPSSGLDLLPKHMEPIERICMLTL